MAITPYLYYRDVDRAMTFLSKAFGFKACGARMRGADGRTNHATMKLGAGVVMMGRPGASFRNPKSLGQATQCLYVSVANADAIFDRALRAGAVAIAEPADTAYGHRRCGVKDPEGHEWYFAHTVRRRRSPRAFPRRPGTRLQ